MWDFWFESSAQLRADQIIFYQTGNNWNIGLTCRGGKLSHSNLSDVYQINIETKPESYLVINNNKHCMLRRKQNMVVVIWKIATSWFHCMELSSIAKLDTERQLVCHNRERENRHSPLFVDLQGNMKLLPQQT
ncbi:MAG: hypothetical protein COA85_05155 [Robiginitomaculum sp.]|nr:MAG: hypothetical protein COA85_05155 [Robiginitomaculum sp.]